MPVKKWRLLTDEGLPIGIHQPLPDGNANDICYFEHMADLRVPTIEQARLMATSPELFAALLDIVNMVENVNVLVERGPVSNPTTMDTWYAAIDAGRSAIRKAAGMKFVVKV